ncbi:MAG: hypothetical protein ACD_46C00220G0001 [uncultured bacterium]|nr:MAG: hypothetical protein ACD_46C00220G0001 [uncultured bacterium]
MSNSFIAKIFNRLPVSVIRHVFNFWPPFRGAGIKVNLISPDFRSCEISLKMRLFNRNYAGVHFGGSLFAMTDPFFMIMLIKNLGDQYIVWDKAGRIDFKKPGKGLIRARCKFSQEEINQIREETNRTGKYIFDRSVDLFNEQNEVVATIIKTLYVKRKDNYQK